MSEQIIDRLRRAVFQRSWGRRPCSHLAQIRWPAPNATFCRACREEGTRTVHLRMCLVCGQVGCCDSSPARHARRHFEMTGHPLMRSIEPGETWMWCYIDEAYLTEADVGLSQEPGSDSGP